MIVVAALGALKEFIERRGGKQFIEDIKGHAMERVKKQREEAIDDAQEKRDDTVDSDVSDWLDDELGGGGPPRAS